MSISCDKGEMCRCSIWEADIPPGIKLRLENRGIRSMVELSQMTRTEVLNLKGVGEITRDKIEQAMILHGLRPYSGRGSMSIEAEGEDLLYCLGQLLKCISVSQWQLARIWSAALDRALMKQGPPPVRKR